MLEYCEISTNECQVLKSVESGLFRMWGKGTAKQGNFFVLQPAQGTVWTIYVMQLNKTSYTMTSLPDDFSQLRLGLSSPLKNL